MGVDDSPLEGELVRRALNTEHEVRIFDRAAPMLERLAHGERPGVLKIEDEPCGLNVGDKIAKGDSCRKGSLCID